MAQTHRGIYRTQMPFPIPAQRDRVCIVVDGSVYCKQPEPKNEKEAWVVAIVVVVAIVAFWGMLWKWSRSSQPPRSAAFVQAVSHE